MILGLSLLARQTTLLLAPLLVLWILFDFRPQQTFGRRLPSAVTFVLPIAALILPFTFHNYRVGQDFVLVNSTGGYSFYMGNRQDPFAWIQLELRKAGLFLNAYEVWNNRSFEISRQFSWVLRLPLISFGLIAPLALLGIALNLRRVTALFPLFAGVAAYFVSALMIFVLSRYRFPGTALMIPFAAFALVDLMNRALRSEWKGLATRFAALFLLSIFVYWPLTSEKRLHMAWYNLGNQFRTLERYEESINAYHQSLQINPVAISTHNNLALALEGSGDRGKAIESWSRVRQLASMRGDTTYIERADRHLADLRSAKTNR